MARPMKYDNTDSFAKKVDEYFDICDSKKEIITTEKGSPKIVYKPYTVSGLCLHLDICRDTLCEYEKLDVFSDTIKKAKGRIENWIEEHSISGDINAVTAIFNLKNNFGWKDKQEVEMTGNSAVIEIKLASEEK